jgi:hypothetical protein
MLFLLLPLSYAIPTQKSPSVAPGVLCVLCDRLVLSGPVHFAPQLSQYRERPYIRSSSYVGTYLLASSKGFHGNFVTLPRVL